MSALAPGQRPKRVLLTGGTGYIGRHILLALLDTQWQPVILDNLSTSHADGLPDEVVFVKGDICDVPTITALFEAHGFDAVIHAAAIANVPDSVANPALCHKVNCDGTRHVLEAAKAHGISAFIFSSTAAVYAPDTPPPFSETTSRCAPISPYGQSKRQAEQMIMDMTDASFKSCLLRYANVGGADPQLRCGDCKPRATTLIQAAVEVALGRRPELMIYGTDYPTPDGTAVRDYIHVSDIASAHVQALHYLAQTTSPSSSVFNLGVGQGHSVRDVIAAMEHALGHSLPQRIGARRDGDPPICFLESTHAQSALDWMPSQSQLSRIVAHSLAWGKRVWQRDSKEDG